jgi:sugar/nucleoside kinase (ribokinase family)
LVTKLDYLVIGHVTRDLKTGTSTAGGTASYAGRAALALGCRVGVVTSTGPALDSDQTLAGAQIIDIPASETTTFENTYADGKRHQMLHSIAEPLLPTMIPRHWQPSIVHVGPVAQECTHQMIEIFDDAFIGVTPQGWMRQWDEDGRVQPCEWKSAQKVLSRADAVVLSEEDVAHDESIVGRYAAQSPLLVVTRGAGGCTVYTGNRRQHFPAPEVQVIDPTGAGDIFAAAFFIALYDSGGNMEKAARFANCIAAHSVTRVGLCGVPTPDEITRCQQA